MPVTVLMSSWRSSKQQSDSSLRVHLDIVFDLADESILCSTNKHTTDTNKKQATSEDPRAKEWLLKTKTVYRIYAYTKMMPKIKI